MRHAERIDMISTFSFPTKILFGPGAVEKLPEELASRGMKKPLLVTDAGLAATAVFTRVRNLIANAVVFTGVEPNPTEKNVLDGTAVYLAEGCDSVVGLGGGSPLDAAKAIRLKATHPLSLAEYDDNIDGWKHITPNVPPFIAIDVRHRQRSGTVHRCHNRKDKSQNRDFQSPPDPLARPERSRAHARSPCTCNGWNRDGRLHS
jgi:hypothetical protein